MTGLHAALAELRDEWLTLGESDVENQRDLWARADRITQILDLHEPSGQVDHEQAYNDLRASIEGLHREIARGPNAAELLGYCAHDGQRYPCLTIRTLPDPSDTATASEGATEITELVEASSLASDGDREGLSDEEIDSRMAKVSNAAIHAAEEVWSEDEPTVAEYELAQRVLDAARLVEVTAARDEADRLAIVANAVAAVTPCVCSAQRTRAEQAEARAEALAEQVAAIVALGELDPVPDGNNRHTSPMADALFNAWAETDESTGDYEAGEILAAAAMEKVRIALASPTSVLAARYAKVAAQALRDAADALEGRLGVAGTPKTLWEFRHWLRARAAGGEVEQP